MSFIIENFNSRKKFSFNLAYVWKCSKNWPQKQNNYKNQNACDNTVNLFLCIKIVNVKNYSYFFQIKHTCVFPPTLSKIAHLDKPTQAGNPSKKQATTFPIP